VGGVGWHTSAVSEPLEFRLLDGTQAAEHAGEYVALHDPAGRFAVHRRQPGFVLAEARHGQYLVGYGYGFPLRPSTDWWRHLTAPLPPEVTTEHAGRTFALGCLAVRASWRRQGIGATLHDMILGDRPEERSTVAVPADACAPAAQAAFSAWGWRKIARTREDGVLREVFVRPLGGSWT
jgi:GNAT superfamily N-acetyltransferase